MRLTGLLKGWAWLVALTVSAGLGWPVQAQAPAAPHIPESTVNAAQPSLPGTSSPGTSSPGTSSPGNSPSPAQAKSQVLIESHGDSPSKPSEQDHRAAGSLDGASQQPVVDPAAKVDLTDADRSALVITAYDLDARLNPARASLSMRAQVTVRNTANVPLKLVALQISSTLHWDSATVVSGTTRTHVPLAQHRLDTDADHTGAETEAIISLPEPLVPGASVSLDLFYSGEISPNGGRLKRLGASAAQQKSADWDAISPAWTGLRGFGDVLWYPVASPQLFLSEGNALFLAVGQTRLRERMASVHLRLNVEYIGSAPMAAYFCGRRQALTALPDDPDAPSIAGSGVARAEFPPEPLGFRTPSLFVLALPETFLPASDTSVNKSAGSQADGSSPVQTFSSSSSGSPSTSASGPLPQPHTEASASSLPSGSLPTESAPPPFLAVVSDDPGAVAGFSAAAEHVAPLLREWLGARPLSALTVLDHGGQPFQDGPLLAAPLAVLGASTEDTALIGSLTHAWIQTGQPWMDEGLAQFFSLLWTERQSGRRAANAALNELMRPVALAEPEVTANLTSPQGRTAEETLGQTSGQPLVDAADDLIYRRKAAAVWWMLRGIVGDGNLHQALSAWHTQPASEALPAEQALAFERLLEKVSGQDLHWFFTDWVLHDRGLPDLAITAVAASQQPVTPGHPGGWVVAVTVRNEGGAVADVPVVVHTASGRMDQRMRIPGLSAITRRIPVENPPTGIEVNDGSTPELRTSTHSREINLQVR